MSPDGYRQLLEQVKTTGVNVWVQDGSGVDNVAQQRERYLQASADRQKPSQQAALFMTCSLPAKGKTFTAKPKPDG
ncbi:DUF4434 domain-containing protein [Shigella flexneri]